jgi:hypothetical protein
MVPTACGGNAISRKANTMAVFILWETPADENCHLTEEQRSKRILFATLLPPAPSTDPSLCSTVLAKRAASLTPTYISELEYNHIAYSMLC